MLAPIMFITGALASITSGVMGIVEDNNRELQYEAERVAGYNESVQTRYDTNYGRLFIAYDNDLIVKDILNDYPQMHDGTARKIAYAAIAKKLMETETKYKYKANECFKYFDLDKYVKAEYRRNMLY